MTRRLRSTIALTVAVVASAAILVAMPAAAAPTAGSGAATSTTTSFDVFPTEIALPNGWLPEGIAIGALPYAFFGSRADGDLYRVNLITGDGSVFSQGPGTPSVGLKVDLRARLFVAGGPGGNGRVVNAITGEILASYTFASAPTFVNDVVLTPQAAWFTDTQRAFLYKVPLGHFGRLPSQADVVEVPLGGAWARKRHRRLRLRAAAAVDEAVLAPSTRSSRATPAPTTAYSRCTASARRSTTRFRAVSWARTSSG